MSQEKFNEVLRKLVERVEERENKKASKEQFILNRIDLKGFKDVQEEYMEDRSLCKKKLEVKGRWRNDLEYGPQFETKLETERAGEILVQTDESTLMGGQGTALHPISLCLAGFCGCYSAAFAKWAAMEGIELNSLRIKTQADVDLSRTLGIDSSKSVVDNYEIKLYIKSKANLEKLNEIAEITKKRCFCYYCVKNPIQPEVILKKGLSNQAFMDNINNRSKKNQIKTKNSQFNRFNLKAFKETKEVYSEDRSLCKKTLAAEGEWRLGIQYGPQFETTLETERAGDITVQTDETIILGGGGTSFHPVALCIAGFSADFLTTFARSAAMRSIDLDSLSIYSRMFIDLTTGFGIEPDIPMIDDFIVEVFTESEHPFDQLRELLDTARERSFCYYCYTTPIIPEVKIIKEIHEEKEENIATSEKIESKKILPEEQIHIDEPHNLKRKLGKSIGMIEL